MGGHEQYVPCVLQISKKLSGCLTVMAMASSPLGNLVT